MSEMTDGPAAGAIPGGQFLTFRLGEQMCGLRLDKVHEVIPLLEVGEVVHPHSTEGDMLVRDVDLIPLVDLRVHAGGGNPRDEWETCVVTVDIAGIRTGIIVDSVHGVLDVPPDEILLTPELRANPIGGIGGLASPASAPIVLLDLDEVLRVAADESHDPDFDVSAPN
jgi:chemotaxis signal transduction protein